MPKHLMMQSGKGYSKGRVAVPVAFGEKHLAGAMLNGFFNLLYSSGYRDVLSPAAPKQCPLLPLPGLQLRGSGCYAQGVNPGS